MPERTPEQHHRPNAVSEIFIAVVVVAGLVLLGGLLAAGASINFFKTNRVYKETEAKSTLGLAYVAERSFRVETGRYSDKLTELGFLPERGNRYLYVFSQDGELHQPGTVLSGDQTGVLIDTARFTTANNDATERAIPEDVMKEVGLRGTCPDACEITIVAAGNIDADPTIDVWSISTGARTIDGQVVPAGKVFHHVKDSD